MVLSLHMKRDGTDAWPSQAKLAKRALLSTRSVVTHLKNALSTGWISRYETGRNGQGWRLYGYVATLPDTVYAALPEQPWEADPDWRRGNNAGTRNGYRRGETNSPPKPVERSLDPKRRASDDSSVVNPTQNVVQSVQKEVNQFLTNLPYESSQELSLRKEGALAHTDRSKGFTKEGISIKIRSLAAAGLPVEAIVKRLAKFNVTGEQVGQERIAACGRDIDG